MTVAEARKLKSGDKVQVKRSVVLSNGFGLNSGDILYVDEVHWYRRDYSIGRLQDCVVLNVKTAKGVRLEVDHLKVKSV